MPRTCMISCPCASTWSLATSKAYKEATDHIVSPVPSSGLVADLQSDSGRRVPEENLRPRWWWASLFK